MILRIVLFLSYTILVSSNNGSPIIPVQTYPIYQPNVYTNPSAYQPSDIIPYLQNTRVQNQTPSLNLSPSNIRQILLNRILSSQPMPAVFDQNIRGYGANLVKYPNNHIVANPVSNYFAAPTVFDYLSNQTTDVNEDNKAADIKTEKKRKKSKRRNSSKSRRKSNHSESENNHKNSSKSDKVKDKNREVSKKSRKKSRKHRTDAASQDNPTKKSENESNKNTRNKKRKNKEANQTKDPIDEDTNVENPKPRRRHKKKPKPDKNNTEKVNAEQQTMPKPKEIHDSLNLANFNEGIIEENRVPRNLLNEGNYLLKSIPNLPENIANSFNFKELPRFNSNNPAMSDFFAKYEDIYKSMMSHNKDTNERRVIVLKPKRSRKNQRRKISVKNRNSTAIATKATVSSKTNTLVVSPKVNIVTTEKTIYINEKTHTNIDPIPKDEGIKSFDNPSEVEKVTVKLSDNKEVRDEYYEPQDIDSNVNSSDPDYSKGYIADYYPVFTDSAAYNANNREVYVKNLGDNKYYYAVDKGNPDFINRMRFESFGLPEHIIKDYEINKKYDDIEKKGIRNSLKTDFEDIKEDVIQFRSPPLLESPDFQTREVVRSEINPEPNYRFHENGDFNHRFVGDKSSSYSEAKTPVYTGVKENCINAPKDKDVETVFARSKVVKYSPVYYPEEPISSSAGPSNQALDNRYFKDEGTTYVLATSLDYPESF